MARRSATTAGVNALARLGNVVVRRWRGTRHVAAVAMTVLAGSLQPRQWTPAVRSIFMRQVLFSGVEAIPFIAMIAIVVGVLVVMQAQVWLTRFGQSTLVGPVLVFIVLREVGPLLTNFVVIGRSGSAITAEVANMKVSGEVHLLDAQGLDPFVCLVVPRALSTAVSVFCLTVVFSSIALLTGFILAFLSGVGSGDPVFEFENVMRSVRPIDAFNLMAKTLIPGLLTGTISVLAGLSAGHAITEVPQAVSRGVIGSVTALFVTLAIVSLLTYL